MKCQSDIGLHMKQIGSVVIYRFISYFTLKEDKFYPLEYYKLSIL